MTTSTRSAFPIGRASSCTGARDTWRRLLRLACLLGACIAGSAGAHGGGSAAFASVAVSGNTVRYSVQLFARALPAAMNDAMRAGDPGLPLDYSALLDAVAARVRFRTERGTCAPVPTGATPLSDMDAGVMVVIHYACPPSPHRLWMEDDLTDVLGPHHQTITDIRYSGGSRQYVFRSDARSLGLDLPRAAGAKPEPGLFRSRLALILSALVLIAAIALLVGRVRSAWAIGHPPSNSR